MELVDAFEIKRSEDGEIITLIFTSDSGNSQEVCLSKNQFLPFAGKIQKEAHGESVVPIRALTEDMIFDVVHFSTRKNHQTGEVILDLVVQLPEQGDRAVTIPLYFSKKDVGALKDMLP